MAKANWKKLRDCFRDALRRQTKKKSGQGATVVRPWIYQKQMEFLIPFMSNRNTSSNLTETEGTSTSQAEIDEEVDGSFEENMNKELSVTDIEEQENSEKSQTVNKGKNKKMKTCDLTEAMMKSLHNYEKRATTRDELRKSMAENKGNETSDPLYQFFMSMYNTTKSLPLSYQLRVKRKVFDTVSEAEEDILKSTSNLTSEQSSWVETSGHSSSMSFGEGDPPLSTYWSDFGKNAKKPLNNVQLK